MAKADPVQMLREDHVQVRDLFSQYQAVVEDESIEGREQKENIADQIFMALDMHATVEEEIFYPTVKDLAAGEDIKRKVIGAEEEHRIVRMLIEELQEVEIGHEEFDPKMKVLMETVENHIKEEESELLPSAEKIISGKSVDMVEEMLALKAQLADSLGADIR